MTGYQKSKCSSKRVVQIITDRWRQTDERERDRDRDEDEMKLNVNKSA